MCMCHVFSSVHVTCLHTISSSYVHIPTHAISFSAAPGPVENLKAVVMNGNPTSAVLEWDKPNRKWDNGDVEKYTVEWRAVANDENEDRQICFQQVSVFKSFLVV